jgi:2-aminoethylphosphonate-pyruvate transaminase
MNISYLISSSNKCIEGVPGFSFILAKKSELEKCKHQSRSLSLDLYDQWAGLNLNGQFRFTPPVQGLMSFHQAPKELEKEGGINARGIRYHQNNLFLVSEMKKIGFIPYLEDASRSYIITSFLFPKHKDFSFDLFYSKLCERGFVIYPGKLSKTECFRIGNIGQLYLIDIKGLVLAIKNVLFELNIEL